MLLLRAVVHTTISAARSVPGVGLEKGPGLSDGVGSARALLLALEVLGRAGRVVEEREAVDAGKVHRVGGQLGGGDEGAEAGGAVVGARLGVEAVGVLERDLLLVDGDSLPAAAQGLAVRQRRAVLSDSAGLGRQTAQGLAVGQRGAWLSGSAGHCCYAVRGKARWERGGPWSTATSCLGAASLAPPPI